MTVYYQLLLDTILSCAETLILFQMYRAFLRRNSRPNKYYYLGLFRISFFSLSRMPAAGRCFPRGPTIFCLRFCWPASFSRMRFRLRSS